MGRSSSWGSRTGSGTWPTAAPGSAGDDRLREGQGDRVGGEPAVAVLVEAVEAEDGDVDDVRTAGEREVGGGARDPRAPHHPVARSGGDRHAVEGRAAGVEGGAQDRHV